MPNIEIRAGQRWKMKGAVIFDSLDLIKTVSKGKVWHTRHGLCVCTTLNEFRELYELQEDEQDVLE